jgi:hypothetical protein
MHESSDTTMYDERILRHLPPNLPADYLVQAFNDKAEFFG